MRPNTSLTLAVAIALAAWTALSAVVAARPAGQIYPRPTPMPDPLCAVDITHDRAPGALLLGDTVAVTIGLKAVCLTPPLPLLIALVADPSDAMRTTDLRDMREAMIRLVDQLDLKNSRGTYVGVIDVGEEARRSTVMVRDVERLKAAIGRIDPGGDTRIDLGIQEADRMLRLARESLHPRWNTYEVMLVFSDGRCATGCAEAKLAAHNAKSHGTLVMAVCVGRNCDSRCMRSIATSSRYFFDLENIGGFLRVFERIRKDIKQVVLKKAVVTETLAPDVDYILDSAQPSPVLHDGGRSLVWSENYIPEEGLTFTLRVQPQAAGRSIVAERLGVYLRDNMDSRYHLTGPTLPPVQVLQPVPVATPGRTPRP